MTHAQVGNSSRRLPAGALRRALAFVLWPVMAGAALWGQTQVTPPAFSPFDGTTPTLSQPGTPADAYHLSSVESINLATGSLSISIPLADLMGRGGAKETLVVHRESQWQVQGYTYLYDCKYGGGGPVCTTGIGYVTWFRPWEPVGPTYAQGVMLSRTTGDWCMHLQDGTTYWWHTLTRLTFIAPDGTEHEFRDAGTGGLLQTTASGSNGFDRGANWLAYDGSSAIFTASSHISDPARNGCTPSSGLLTTGGTVTLRDGTRYTRSPTRTTSRARWRARRTPAG